MVVHRLSSVLFWLKKAVYRLGKRLFFSSEIKNYLRTEITSTIRVANAIINDNVSYTLMLITSPSRGKAEYIELSHNY